MLDPRDVESCMEDRFGDLFTKEIKSNHPGHSFCSGSYVFLHHVRLWSYRATRECCSELCHEELWVDCKFLYINRNGVVRLYMSAPIVPCTELHLQSSGHIWLNKEIFLSNFDWLIHQELMLSICVPATQKGRCWQHD